MPRGKKVNKQLNLKEDDRAFPLYELLLLSDAGVGRGELLYRQHCQGQGEPRRHHRPRGHTQVGAAVTVFIVT